MKVQTVVNETKTRNEDGTFSGTKQTETTTEEVLEKVHPHLRRVITEKVTQSFGSNEENVTETREEKLYLGAGPNTREDRAYILSETGLDAYRRTAEKSLIWTDHAVVSTSALAEDGTLPEEYRVVTTLCQNLDRKLVPFYVTNILPWEGYDRAHARELLEAEPDVTEFNTTPCANFKWLPHRSEFQSTFHCPSLNLEDNLPEFDLSRLEPARLKNPDHGFLRGVEAGLKLALIALNPETWDGRGVHYSHFKQWTNDARGLLQQVEEKAKALHDA